MTVTFLQRVRVGTFSHVLIHELIQAERFTNQLGEQRHSGHERSDAGAQAPEEGQAGPRGCSPAVGSDHQAA